MKNIENVTDFAFTYKGARFPVIWQFAKGVNKGLEAVVLGFDESNMANGGLSLVLDVGGQITRSFVGIDSKGFLFSDVMKPSHYGEPVPFRYNG
jgi:hypothetical protein